MINSMKLATLMLLCAISGLSHGASARSIFDSIPEANMLRDLSKGFLETINNVADEGINAVGKGLDELNPYIKQITECAEELCPVEPADQDAKRNVSEIIHSRGYLSEEHDVTTSDGYVLTIQRIVNPLVAVEDRPKLKPVILQHGLLSSSVDWVLNSVNVRPEPFPRASTSLGNTNTIDDQLGDSQEHPNSLGFYMANKGYDVFLANSRGNVYGQKHLNMSTWNPKFWSFTFDEQIKYDLPDTIEFVRKLTKHDKVGYVGHSQGTTMIFGLLADRPEYADIIEPIVALAPVAYVNNCLSPVKHFAVYAPIFQHINMWFGSSNVAVRYLASKVCGPKTIRKEICTNIVFLSTGFDEAEFDDSRMTAYLAHMPSGTSVKNIAHWGQMVNSGRFAHFDHGVLGNELKYGQSHPPDYDLTKITSRSISLFTAENDWLASPKDVAHLKAQLQVPLFKSVNISELNSAWNHIDFVVAKDCGRFVNAQVLEVFDHFN